MPMLRPISFVDQLNDETIDRDHEFLCGDHILVCPVVNEGAKSRKVYLPSGQWYHFWTNEEYEGQQTHQVNTPMDQIPCFVMAGAIVPEFPIQQYVGEKVIEEIKLNIYYKHGIEGSQFYDDDRETYGYEQNEFLLVEFEMTGENDKVIIDRRIKGKYQSKIKSFELILIGIPFEIDKIICDGHEIDFSNESMVVKSDFKQLVLLK
jgi:alpha-glucosidase